MNYYFPNSSVNYSVFCSFPISLIGQKLADKAFIDAIKDGSPSPIPYNEIIEVASYSIEIANSLRI